MLDTTTRYLKRKISDNVKLELHKKCVCGRSGGTSGKASALPALAKDGTQFDPSAYQS